MTDERLGPLLPVLRRLPPRTGVVFRHHATPPAERRALLRHATRIAAARRLVLVATGKAARDGIHGPGNSGGGLRTWPAHDRREALTGRRAGARVLFVSPVFPTRSHPGVPAAGPRRAAHLGRRPGTRVIALGGMTAARWRRIRHLGFDGWAAIDAWI
jgi:thiamine-phosphate pyrophosphorylase